LCRGGCGGGGEPGRGDEQKALHGQRFLRWRKRAGRARSEAGAGMMGMAAEPKMPVAYLLTYSG
jgi:hypothetical protein